MLKFHLAEKLWPDYQQTILVKSETNFYYEIEFNFRRSVMTFLNGSVNIRMASNASLRIVSSYCGDYFSIISGYLSKVLKWVLCP